MPIYENTSIKYSDLNKIIPNNKDKSKSKKYNYSKFEDKLQNKLIDKFGSINNITNPNTIRSGRYKNTMNNSADFSA